MAKKKGVSFPLFAALGALTGYAGYMANKNEFSNETKDKYDAVVNKVKDIGEDVKRTYISLGDKEKFEASTKRLSSTAKRAAKSAGELMKSAGKDMYEKAKKSVAKAVDSMSDAPKKSTKKVSAKKTTKSKTTKSAPKKTTKKVTKKTSK